MHFLAHHKDTFTYILTVVELLRKNARFYTGTALAGLILRLFFVFRFPAIVEDSRLYANIALNWLHHGIYAITDSGKVMPTFSRLPGYPAFLACVFSVFGDNNFRAVLLIQVIFDLGTCLLIADLARRLHSERSAKAAFLLAAICPFLANYSAAALTETLEIFFTALALDLVVSGIADPYTENKSQPNHWRLWLFCGLSIGVCILLRPDGGILYGAIGAYLLFRILQRLRTSGTYDRALLSAAVLLTIGAFAPLVPWTLRNLHTMHRFEPLAPRYANDADEYPMTGFNRWVKTWMAEYTTVDAIYWNVPGTAISINDLPDRAFDSPEQRTETALIFDDYNRSKDDTPEIDVRFSALAATRIHAARLRYYLWLPTLRIADMWLRPRIELLPSDPAWWKFDDDPLWLTVSIVFGLTNLGYVVLATLGILRSTGASGIGMLLLFLLLRSLFLGTLENPEPRYTLECYPVILAFASALWMRPHTKYPG